MSRKFAIFAKCDGKQASTLQDVGHEQDFISVIKIWNLWRICAVKRISFFVFSAMFPYIVDGVCVNVKWLI